MVDVAANVDPREHPDTVMSEEAKSEVASLAVKGRAIPAVLVEAPLATALAVMAIVGTVLSIVTAPVFAVVSASPELPAASS